MNKRSLDFDQARTKHLQFKSKLRSILYGAQIDENPVLTHTECGVGKWIYGHALATYGHLPEMHELEQVHKNIHLTAQELVVLYKEGKIEEARNGLGRVEEIAHSLIDLLYILEKKTQSLSPDNPSDTQQVYSQNMQDLQELQKANYELEERIRQQTVELQKTKEQFDLVSRATNDAIWDWDLITGKVLWNESFKTMFGYKQEDIEPNAESWYGRIHPEDQERVVNSIHRVIDHGGKQWSDEYRFRRADGTYAYIFDRGYALHDEQGRPYRMLGSMLDITEKVQTQKTIEENARQVTLMLESLPQITWMASKEGVNTYLNGKWYEYTGASPDSTIRFNLKEYLHPEDFERTIHLWRRCLVNGDAFDIEYRLQRKDGMYRWMLGRALPLRKEGGIIMQWMGTCTDIHDLKIAEQELQAITQELASSNEELSAANEEIMANNDELYVTNARLSEVNADLDNFIYTASHDLKAPISNIEGLINLLTRKLSQKGWEDENTKGIVQMINASVIRFKETIADLTEITKLQKQAGEEMVRVSIPEIIEDVRLDLSSQIQESNAHIEININICPDVVFSRKNLKSIIYNLLSNAIKYRDPERVPQIHISCQIEGNFHILTVQDNGLGMNLSKDSKIFGMFKRLHTHVEGTGIGLYIVKKIIENSGGKIEVESQVGKGSIFRVYFKH